jgi:hypothetical protein
MKNLFLVLGVGSMILLIIIVFGSIVIGSTWIAYNEHWSLGLLLTLVWTSMIFINLYERLEQK